MSMLSGVGVLVWGGLLFGFFNGYLESTEFQRGAQVVLGTTSIAFLVAVVGVYDSFVRSRLGRVILGGMGVVSLGMFLGAALTVFTRELGGTVMLASYILLVAGGTLLGMEFLRSGGPRSAAWSLAISGPLFLLTDKLLWEPLNALLGVDITALLNTVPFAVGMVLLGRVLRAHSVTVESEYVGAEND
ncbi:hypothetical protein [Salinigranum sp. GCM10025319]|uniref:hypothetical protein n=1 Tax=Salinigranum sp. GCM10025319 TaxID=3252687 RepID=UPI0036159E2C